MKTRSNLHTHTTYCDGRNSMEEMVQAAIALGFRSLGFSSHAYTGASYDVCGIKKDRIDSYFAEIDSLQKKYEGQIRLYKGFEIEGYVPFIDPRLDFSIGSIHVFQTPLGLREIDNTPEIFQSAIDAFKGNVWQLLEGYFEDMVHYACTSEYDITGHFDVVTKFIEKMHFFDESDQRYIDMAISAIDSICKIGKIIEVNTGGMARGYREKEPYPASMLLKRVFENKAPIIISSDCHRINDLAGFFDYTEKLLISIGFKEQMELTDKGFKSVSLF